MALGSWDVLSPFEPPHLDTVTGMTVKGDHLISGSKDKHLKLWDLNHGVNNNKHTFLAFNDYVTSVQGNLLSIQVPKTAQYSTLAPKMDRLKLATLKMTVLRP